MTEMPHSFVFCVGLYKTIYSNLQEIKISTRKKKFHLRICYLKNENMILLDVVYWSYSISVPKEKN